jgi:hypothetical protein
MKRGKKPPMTPRAIKTSDAKTAASPLRYAGCIVLATAGGAALQLLRQRGVPVWDSLWAEDGRIFLTGAVHDFWTTLFAQYGGYMHIVARLVAGVVSVFPATDAAAAMASGAALVLALLAAFIYEASVDVLPSRAARLLLASVFLFVPVAGSELIANVTNLHFYLLFACFWALLWQSDTATAVATRSAVVLVATLSDPLSGLLLPLAVVAPIVRRRVHAVVVSTVYAAGLAVQALAMLGGQSPQREWAFRASDLPSIFSLRVSGGLLVGDRFLGDLWLRYGGVFSYSAFAIVAAIVVLLAVRSDSATTSFVVIALGYAGLFFCTQLVGRGTRGMAPRAGSFDLNEARYVLLPFLFLTAALLALVDRGAARHKSRGWRWARRATLAWIACIVAVNYSVTTDRSRGPRWSRELASASHSCALTRGGIAHILVSPSPPRVWFASIPCGRIVAGGP